MTLVMLAVTPFLAGMGFAISIFMSRNTSTINKAYGGEGRVSLAWLCRRLPHAAGFGCVGRAGPQGCAALPTHAIMP
jgi:hypothetical protein